MGKWLKRKILCWLGIPTLETRLSNRIGAIENIVQVGADLNFKTPSWIVVCLRGKNQDVVRFFDLPDNDIARLFDELKELERRFHTRPVFDAPPYIKREYFKW